MTKRRLLPSILLPFCSIFAIAAATAEARAVAGPGGPRVDPPAGITALSASSATSAVPPAVAPWTQDVHYRIEARLDEASDVLAGQVRIRYTNNSPDTLRAFYVHQHLNAFRPNSAWARADLERGIRTFQDLGPDEHAFERIVRAEVDGTAVEPFHPHAPDSTIAGLELPAPLLPGGSVTVDIRWDARLSTVPRRQGRRGRDYDFAQWYPRVVVYDLEGWRTHPLFRQGEFYGEFATYDVTLELAEDQVVGSTGVPLEGDPGWEGAAAAGTGPVEYLRDWYGTVDGPPCVEAAGVRTCGVPGPAGAGPGAAEPLDLLGSAEGVRGAGTSSTKHIRWYAKGVHHFAWSASPEYIYEQGRFEDVAIRVLYRPGDEASWGEGVAVERTVTAMAWMDSIFGDYVWPQVTNLHRIEPGGTEFPMVIMDGSASLGLIVHEINHQYVHGILGNNEWYEGWLDEGMSSFLESWFFERGPAGRGVWLGTEAGVIDLELRGRGAPVTYPAEDYAEYGVYGAMVYSKGSLVLRMLRDLAGEEDMVRLLRAYYDRYALRHVDGDAFQEVAEEVLRRDLDWFFGQWLHANGVVDYALEEVEVGELDDAAGTESVDAGDRVRRAGSATANAPAAGGSGADGGRDGRWYRTSFTVERRGEMIMPVPVRIRGAGEGASAMVMDTVVDGTGFRERVTVVTPFEPDRVELDPEGTILDWNGMNDFWSGGFPSRGGVERSFQRPLGSLQAYRDRLAAGFLPLFWANDAGGAVVGLQRHTHYMGSMHRSTLRIGAPGFSALDRGGESRHGDVGSLYYRIDDPVLGDRPRFGTSFEIFLGEGRLFSRVEKEWDLSRLPVSGPRRFLGAYLLAADVYDPAYLIPGRWNTGEGSTEGTGVEGGLGLRRVGTGDAGRWSVALQGGAGISTQAEAWLRGSVEAQWRGGDDGWVPSLRLFAGGAAGNVSGGAWSGDAVPLQRRFGVSGAGPYATLGDPWGRSRGALLEREVHHRGDGNLRGYRRDLMTDAVVSLGAELGSPSLVAGPLRISASVFGDLGWVPDLRTVEGGPFDGGMAGDLVISIQENPLLADAGAGLILGWEGAPLGLRVDVPFFVAHPDHARSGRSDTTDVRWAVSVESR